MDVDVKDINLGFLFLRALVKKDFGEIHKKKSIMSLIPDSISRSLNSGIEPKDALVKLFQSKGFKSRSPDVQIKYFAFENYLRKYIAIPNALKILYNCVKIIEPLINNELEQNKKNADVINQTAKAFTIEDLNREKDNAIENIITKWGDYSEENSQVFKDTIGQKLFDKVSKQLKESDHQLDETLNKSLTHAAFATFHSRCSQSGKQAAGKGHEMAVRLILEHLDMRLDKVPHQITGDLEADLTIKKGGQGGYDLLVSCKTTAKERFKQALPSSRGYLLSQNISRIIWFFRKCDLSIKQVNDIGVRGGIIYLPDNSPEFKMFMANGLGDFVLPLSTIRKTLDKYFNSQYGPICP